MSALTHWLSSGLIFGTIFFAAAWLLSKTLLRNAHPSARALLFGLVLLKFVVPFGPSMVPVTIAPETGAAVNSMLTVKVVPLSAPQRELPWQTLAMLVWAAGVVALCVRRVVKHRALLQMLGAPNAASNRVVELAARLGVAAPQVVTHESGPCLVGVARPLLVLPANVNGAELDAMIVHELTHLRRRDPVWRALQAVVETLFFFWPVVRVASRQLSLAREQACDLSVVETGVISRTDYAEVLLQLGLESSANLAMAAEPSHLERRIQMVLSGKKLRPMWAVVAVVGVAGLALASASVTVEPDPASVPPAAPMYFTQPAPKRLHLKGSIDERVLEMEMATRRSSLDACYLDYLREHPEVGAGTVILHFAIQTDGTVKEGCQSEGTTLPMEVGRCVTDQLMRWPFPMPYDLQDVALEYRFDFVPPVTQT
ncbi:MAG: M56 family metallopeptidase [Archangium sp.]